MYELYANPSLTFKISELIVLLLLVGTFFIASYQDIKTRLIKRKTWIPLAVGLVLLFIARLSAANNMKVVTILTVINGSIAFLLGYILYRANLLGFADCIGFSLLGIYFSNPVQILQPINETLVLFEPPVSYLYLPVLSLLGTASLLVIVGAIIRMFFNSPIGKMRNYGIVKGNYLALSTNTVNAHQITEHYGVAMTDEMVRNSSLLHLVRLTQILPSTAVLTKVLNWSDEDTIADINLELLQHIPSEVRGLEISNKDKLVEYVSSLQETNNVHITRHHPFILYIFASILIYIAIGDIFLLIVKSIV